jgi:hypothetical protein
MRVRIVLATALLLAGWPGQNTGALAQPRAISDADCQSLRQRLAEHARLSDGVRRAVATQATASPAPPAAVGTAPAPLAGRADAIRARLEQIPKERQILEDQRLAAVVKFDLSRAGTIQTQIQALDAEKAKLEQELPTAPAGSTTPASPAPATSDAGRIRCQDVPAALDNAMKIRRRELGAREDQTSAIPLVGLKGQTPDQIAQELAGQFSPGPGGGTQVGLLDADGDGRVDGIVDKPAPGSLRLVRQRSDGTLSVEMFAVPGSAGAPAYGEMTRRLDESTARQTGQTLADMLAVRAAGPARAVTQSAEFGTAYDQFVAGNFADAARLSAPAARSAEFPNFKGENVRVVEIISPVSGGVSLRRVVVLPRANDQELWEEITTIVRPASYWRSDVEVVRSRETHTTAGALVGTRSTNAPVKFTLER